MWEPPPLSDMAGTVNDGILSESELRYLPRPKEFSGKKDTPEWKEWSIKIAAYLGCLHANAPALLKEAASYPETIRMVETPWMNKLSRIVYLHLTMQVHGVAFEIVRGVEEKTALKPGGGFTRNTNQQ